MRLTFHKALIALLLLSSCALAQVPVSTKLMGADGQAVPGAFLRFALQNCGANFPIYSNTPLIVVQRTVDIRANGNGQVVGQILPNDLITCGNIASTRWLVTPMKDSATPLSAAQCFNIVSTSYAAYGGGIANFDPAVQQPCSTSPPTPGFIPIFSNPIANQTWNQPLGTKAFLVGAFDFSGATVTGLNVSASIFPNCTTGLGSFAMYVSATGINCENYAGSDLLGHVFGQSFTALGTNNGALFVVGGSTDPLISSFPPSTFGWLARTVLSSSYFCRVPNTPGSTDVGKVLSLSSWDNTHSICDLAFVAPTGGGTPASPVTAIQFNCSGSFCGDSTFTFNSATKQESVANTNGIRYAQQYNWSQTPSGSISAGANTVTLTPCPLGIDTSNSTSAPYYVYVATTGTAEAVRITGGTCTPGAASGTVVFTAVNTHSAGYSVQSASGGIKEAIDDAGSPDSKVIIGPTGANVNAIQVYAPIFINKNRIEISAEGAHVKCFTRSRCMQSGDTAVATDWNIIKIRGLRFESMINIDGAQVTNVSRTSNITTVTTAAAHNFSMTGNAGDPDVIWLNYFTIASNIPNYHGYCILASVIDSTHFTCAGQAGSNFSSGAVFGWTALNNAAIEDDAENTTMQDIALLTTGSPRFHNFIVVDNDQAAKVINLATDSSGVRCNANFCGSIVTTRSDNGNAGILTVDKSEISLQCQGNAISALASNLVSIHDTVIQGFQQWGVRYEGGISSVLIDGSYIQGDGCTNPLYSGSLGASVGLITTTATVKGANLPLGGLTPTFANTGATQRNYYVVPQQLGAFAAGPFLYAGSALTNGAGTVTVQWPQVPGDGGGVVTYDLLITTGASASAPYAGSATSIATGITSANCSNGICSFSDTLGAGSAYTYAFNGHSGFGYAPDVWLWPSGIMLLAGPGIFPNVYMDQPVFTQSVAGPTGVSVSARGCSSTLASIWVQCEVSGPASAVQLGAEVLQQEDNSGNGASQFASKGRTIYQYGGAHGAYDIVTFIDSNTDKTLATPGNRPAADAADSAVGVDTSNVGAGLAGLAWRTPVSHSWYINSLPDGSSWKARLTNTLLKLVVPTQITETTFASLTGSITCNAGAAGTKRPISDSSTSSVGATISGSGSNHVEAYCNGTNWVVGEGGAGGASTASLVAETITNVNNAASPYTVLGTDGVIRCDATAGAVTINLPAATATKRELQVKKIDSSANACTVSRNGSDTIDGATTVVLSTQYAQTRVQDSSSGLWDRMHQSQFGGDLAGIPSSANVKQAHWTVATVNNAASPYTVLSTDTIILCDATAGAVVLNLPAASGSGREITVKKIDSTANACTPTRNGADTIDGGTTTSITFQYAISSMVDTASGKWSSLLGILSATPSGGAGGQFKCPEGTDPGTEATGFELFWCSSSNHFAMLSNNNGTSKKITQAGADINNSDQVTGINGTAFSGTNGDLVKFGASNVPADSGILATNVVRKDAANTGGASMTLDMSAAAATTGLRLPNAAGAAPTVDGNISEDTTTHSLRCGNGTTTTRCMVQALVSSGGNATAPLSSTQFTKLVGGASINGTTEVSVRQMLPFAGTLSNLCVTTSATQNTSGSLVITIKDSTAAASAGSLTVTFPATQAATTICDNVNSDSVTAQHDYVLQFVNNATTISASVEGISMVYTY